ncbi:hypothetical protein Ancab_010545 [Ancistrocladus abbreviatus]
MISMKTLSYAPPLSYFWIKNWPSSISPTLSISLSLRRTNLRRREKNPKRSPILKASTSDPIRYQITIDIEDLKRKCELKLNEIMYSGTEACKDIQNLITIDSSGTRVLISCSETTVRFFGGLVLFSCVVVVAFRFLVKLGLGLRVRGRSSRGEVVRRRDRSLGGREVVVGRGMEEIEKKRKDLRAAGMELDAVPVKWIRREARKLPNWWPFETLPRALVVNSEASQKEANKLIRAIMDDRISGKDISEDNIIELRRICRKSGAKVSIEAANSRDSFYRLAVQFVINTCCKHAAMSPVQIDGEDPRLFIAGLADNIGLTNVRAATFVSAAVASQTRLWFLQAWALEIQGKHFEAVDELSKICLIHRIFPPESFSPEIEMVARGLEKHLRVEQRQFLLDTLVGVCGEESQRSAAEALGLAPLPKAPDGQQANGYT